MKFLGKLAAAAFAGIVTMFVGSLLVTVFALWISGGDEAIAGTLAFILGMPVGILTAMITMETYERFDGILG